MEKPQKQAQKRSGTHKQPLLGDSCSRTGDHTDPIDLPIGAQVKIPPAEGGGDGNYENT